MVELTNKRKQGKRGKHGWTYDGKGEVNNSNELIDVGMNGWRNGKMINPWMD